MTSQTEGSELTVDVVALYEAAAPLSNHHPIRVAMTDVIVL